MSILNGLRMVKSNPLPNKQRHVTNLPNNDDNINDGVSCDNTPTTHQRHENLVDSKKSKTRRSKFKLGASSKTVDITTKSESKEGPSMQRRNALTADQISKNIEDLEMVMFFNNIKNWDLI